jgi:hypothetical protein
MPSKISMKPFPIISLVVLAGLVLTGETRAASLAFQGAVLADNPIAYYQFAELPGALVSNDVAGGHDGSYSVTGVTLGQAGIGGGDTGAHFDGTGSGRVLVPDAPVLNPALITIESLMRWDGPNGFQQRIIEKSFFLDGTQALYNLSILNDGRVQAEFRASGPVILTGATVMTPGESHHLATTFDLGTFKLYVDGVLEASLAHPFPGNYLQSSPQTIGIGNQFERDRAFNGLIDELAIYDRALTQTEIQAHLAAVPVPTAAWLFGSGLLGLVGIARRKARA